MKLKKLISSVLAVTLFLTSLFVGTVTASANALVSLVNTYDEENTSYSTENKDGELASYLTVDGVKDDWYRFATWNASVEKDTTKTGSEQNAVQFVKAAKINYGWPAAVRIYDNNSSAVPHFKAEANTTYEIKVKYYAVTAPDKEILLQVRNSNTSNIHETGTNDATKIVANKVVSITEATNGWVTATAQFTTGDTVGYLNLTLCSATESDAKNVNVWIDDVELNECKQITAHAYNGSNKSFTVTASTVLSDIEIPQRDTYILEGIYSDALYTNKLSSTDKLASFNHIYYKWVKSAKRTYYCGFENYSEQIESFSIDKNVAEIVEGTAYAESKSLKLALAANGLTAYELRDATPFDIVAGKEYEITFAYKASAPASFHAGLALAGDITGTAESKTFVNAESADDWKTLTLSFVADKSTTEGYALVMLVQTGEANVIYVDDVKITYSSEGNTTLDEIDFGFTGDTFPELKVFNEAVDGIPEVDEGEDEEVPEETEPTVWNGSVAESFAGGTGTESDPYIIETAEQLALAITQSGTTTQANAETGETETINETYYGSYYKLTKDIYLNDINSVNWLTGTKNDGYTVNPWYDYYNYDGKIRGEDFAGVIDGNGFAVYGLYFDNGNKLASSNNNHISSALIPRVASGFTVKVSNLGVDYAYIHHNYVAGVFVGGCASAVSISNSFVGSNARVEGRDSGAFVANGNQKAITLTNCYSLASYGVDVGAFRYGLVSYAYHSTFTVKNCYNLNGPITSQSNSDYSTYYKFYNSYQTVANGTGASRSIYTNVATISANQMKGTDVFSDETKMPYLALNTDGSVNTAYTATKEYPVLTLWAPEEPEIEEGETEEAEYDIWDGKTKTEPKDVNTDGIYEITNGAELAYIIVNHGGEGKKYALTNDIYLNDITKINWETGDVAIGYTPNRWYGNDNYFEGTIDGMGHTVHGMFRDGNSLETKTWMVYGVGLVPRVLHGDTCVIQNLGVDHAFINYEGGVSAFVGCAGSGNSNPANKAEVTIEQCYAGKEVTLIGHSVGVFRGAGRGSNTYIRNCYSLASVDAVGDYGLASQAWDAAITIEGSFNANGPLTTASSTVSNSYQTEKGKHSAVTSVANMKGADVLTNSAKMPLLNSDVFKANEETFEEYDFYVYLPAGTTFAEDISVEFYSDLYIKLDKDTVLVNGEMQKGAYVKFAEEPDESKITVPADLKEFVRYGLREELQLSNPYYGVKLDFINREIAGDNTVKYAFITDIHYIGAEDYPRAFATLRQIEYLVEYVNANDEIDFVAIGGDTIQGTQNKTTSLNYFKKAFTPFLNCNKPVVIVPGNHDDNSYAYDTKKFNGSQVITDKEWNDNIIDTYVNRSTEEGDIIDVSVVQDSQVENTKYYYYDLEDKKTRVICLDAIDYEQSYDENGLLTVDENGNVGLTVRNSSKDVTDYQRYYMATTYWGYGARQMEWLAEDALQAGDDWDYIFISHMGIDEDTNFNTGADITWYGKDLRAIIGAYQFKTSYVNEELGISVDFSGTKGEILSYQYGHTHAQKSLYSADIDLWQINSSTAQHRDGYFDIMSVNGNAIERYNVGRGKDERFVQTKTTLAGDLTSDGTVDICDAVKLNNINASGENLTTKVDINKDSIFDIAADLAAILNILIS